MPETPHSLIEALRAREQENPGCGLRVIDRGLPCGARSMFAPVAADLALPLDILVYSEQPALFMLELALCVSGGLSETEPFDLAGALRSCEDWVAFTRAADWIVNRAAGRMFLFDSPQALLGYPPRFLQTVAIDISEGADDALPLMRAVEMPATCMSGCEMMLEALYCLETHPDSLS